MKYEYIGINPCLLWFDKEQRRICKGDIVEVDREIYDTVLFKKVVEKISKKKNGGKE